jgi:hypothetical protein
MDVSGASSDSEAELILYSTHKGENQQFTFEPAK